MARKKAKAPDLNPIINEAIQLVPISALKRHPDNPRRGDVAAIRASIRAHGFYGALVVQRSSGYILAGNHRFDGAAAEGYTELPVCYVDVDDRRARAILAGDNRTSDLGGYDDEALAALLSQLQADDALDGTGYDDGDLDDLLHSLAGDFASVKPEATVEAVKAKHPDLAVMPYFCMSMPEITSHLLAKAMRWRNGINSGMMLDREVEKSIAKLKLMSIKMRFIDNDFKAYDHTHHLHVVKSMAEAIIKPEIVTTRDIMTKTQCDTLGIEYYPLEQILDFAAELEEHAQRVIIIPKFDCMDRIPERYMLGYSVQSSYGATPLAPEAFKGRDVHLLGGSWKRHLSLIEVLGSDVKSLDNNMVSMQAGFGGFQGWDGSNCKVNELFGVDLMQSHRYLALACSFASVRTGINKLCSNVQGDEHDEWNQGWSEDISSAGEHGDL